MGKAKEAKVFLQTTTKQAEDIGVGWGGVEWGRGAVEERPHRILLSYN